MTSYSCCLDPSLIGGKVRLLRHSQSAKGTGPKSFAYLHIFCLYRKVLFGYRLVSLSMQRHLRFLQQRQISVMSESVITTTNFKRTNYFSTEDGPFESEVGSTFRLLIPEHHRPVIYSYL